MAELPETSCIIRLSKCADDIDNLYKSGTFYIKARFRYSWSVVDEDTKVEKRKFELFVPHDRLLNESGGRLYLTELLSAVKVPARDHRLITEKILRCARSMARRYPNVPVGVLPMSVTISCWLDDVQDLDEAALIGSIREKCYCNRAMLVDVKIEGEAGTCSICFEDIPSGSFAAILPCSHVYHRRCIRTWIVKSGMCPLCRSNT